MQSWCLVSSKIHDNWSRLLGLPAPPYYFSQISLSIQLYVYSSLSSSSSNLLPPHSQWWTLFLADRCFPERTSINNLPVCLYLCPYRLPCLVNLGDSGCSYLKPSLSSFDMLYSFSHTQGICSSICPLLSPASSVLPSVYKHAVNIFHHLKKKFPLTSVAFKLPVHFLSQWNFSKKLPICTSLLVVTYKSHLNQLVFFVAGSKNDPEGVLLGGYWRAYIKNGKTKY